MSKDDEDATEKDSSQTDDSEDRASRDGRDEEDGAPRGPLAKTSSGNADDITES
jgi:hypothetical protein